MVSYLVQIGIAFDMLLNAFLGGEAGQTISMRAALAAEKRIAFWCVFCRLLSWLVQRDHCADQLAGIPMKFGNYFRAFIGLGALAGVLAIPFVLVWRIL